MTNYRVNGVEIQGDSIHEVMDIVEPQDMTLEEWSVENLDSGDVTTIVKVRIGSRVILANKEFL